MGTPHARCRDIHQSSRSASMPVSRFRPGVHRKRERGGGSVTWIENMRDEREMDESDQ
jgi:hypothetical protein